MAELGKGDPRWIVKERADGTNCGNWHWSEKNFTPWFQDEMKSRLCNQTITADDVVITTGDFSKYDVEALLKNRKGRAGIFLDGSFTLDWSAQVGDETVKGTLLVHDVEPDFGPSYEIVVTITSGTGATAERALTAGRTAGRKFIYTTLPEVIATFKEHSGVKQMNEGRLTAKGDIESLAKELEKKAEAAKAESKPPVVQESLSDRNSYKYTVHWGAPGQVIMNALLDQGMLSALTRSHTTVERKEGGKFSVLGGAVEGRITTLEEGKKLAMDFRSADWTPDEWSKVVLEFDNAPDSSRMTIEHTQIPPSDFERTSAGWRNIFWIPMNRLFGYSMRIEE